MNIIAKLLLSASILTIANSAWAELMLDTKYFGTNKNYNQLDWDEAKPINAFMHNQKENIKKDLIKSGEVFDDPSREPPISWGGVGHAHAVFNNKDYYIRAFDYQNSKQTQENRQSTIEKREGIAVPGGGVCMLYVQDKDLNKAASLKIALPENNFGTWCNGVDGLGAAGKGRDGVIVALSYYLTGKAPAKKAQDIGQGWRYMTVLIRWREENGKLILTQDDSCLGNPNKIKDIPSARKALDKCGI
ncbi:hypothetical protein PWG14_20930 (plasmid) [Chromobacterium amazonense]|uniref:hypothetical protein n=1 Tax=Chromobacterium amazonense TaxID=1382803 RepID=UPI00237D77A1|nr:hypothetical protein [Chromobacterium amazonense]MDE1714957.1 hypothetical protein [Chromobacterium amazonense]